MNIIQAGLPAKWTWIVPLDKEIVALTLIVSVITLGTRRTTLLQGVIHLVIFAAFLFFAIVP